MGDGLSLEGLLAQTQRVARARWPALAVTAALWALSAWLVVRMPMLLMMSDLIGYDDTSQRVLAAVATLPGLVGMSVMLSLVARTGMPGRPLGAIFAHALLASATVVAVTLIYGGGIGFLRLVARSEVVGESWLAYPLAFLPMAFQIGLFAYLGMTLPAALERPVGPLKAMSVGLRLSRGRRIWLALIALVWSTAITVPSHVLDMFITGQRAMSLPLLLLGTMLSTFGLGVLYLELRRLHTAGVGATASEETVARPSTESDQSLS